jgi:hypothetical protein
MPLKPLWQNSALPPPAQTHPVPPQLWNIPPPLLLPPLLLPPLLLPLLLLPPLLPPPGGVTPPLPPPMFPQAFEQERISHELMLSTHCWQLAEMLLAHPW